MAGNVSEQVNDWYQADYYHRSPWENPTGPSSGESRVLCSGSWASYPLDSRSANRDSVSPGDSFATVGFRCARGSH